MLYAFSIGTLAFAAWRLLALNTVLQMIRQRYDPQHPFQGRIRTAVHLQQQV